MIKEFDPRSSLEDVAAQASSLKRYVGVGETLLVENAVVSEWEGVTSRRAGNAAAEWLTGRRTKSEKLHLIETTDVRSEFLGALCLDLVTRRSEEGIDAEDVKLEMLDFLNEAYVDEVAWSFKRRLEMSSVERGKMWAAQHPIKRLALPVGLQTVTTAAAYKALQASSQFIDLSPVEQGGTLGIALAMANVAFKSIQRNSPSQLGMVFKNLSTASLRPYMLEGLDLETEDGSPISYDELMRKFAERHLRGVDHKIGNALMRNKVKSEEEFSLMVDHALAVGKESILASYGIEIKKTESPLRERVLGRLALAR